MRTEIVEAVARLLVVEEFPPELARQLNREEGFYVDFRADVNVVLTTAELAEAVRLAAR